ncbi:unnamed protein product, partial [Mesorhabditis spiculigera]
MFNYWNIFLRDLTRNKDKNSTFIQWHGMKEESCPGSDAFVSAGANPTATLYLNQSSIPNRITRAVRTVSKLLKANTPREDKKCRLVAETNVFGRYIYGVPFQKLCKTPSSIANRDGTFIHIEQHANSRDNLDIWIKALQIAFKTIKIRIHDELA